LPSHQPSDINAEDSPSEWIHSGEHVTPDRAYHSPIRSRSTDFGQAGFEPEQAPATLKPAFDLGF